MAEKLAALKQKGGGGLKETVLWTNSAPTNTFNSQAITLSDSIDNYDYVRVYWRVSTTNSTLGSILFAPSELLNLEAGTVSAFGSRTSNGSTTTYFRFLQRNSSTSLAVSTCLQRNTSTAANSTVIPTQITGCKL